MRPDQRNERKVPSGAVHLVRLLQAGLLCSALSVTAPGLAAASGDGSLLSEASAARAAGDFTGAIATLDRVLAETPDNSDALIELGFAHLALGNIPAARDAFERTLAIAPDYADATLGLAYAAFRSDEVAETIRLAKRVLQDAPEYQAAADLLATAQAAQAADEQVTISLASPTRPKPRATFSNIRPPVARPGRTSETVVPSTRRFFFSVGQRLGRQDDLDANLAVEIRKPSGVSLVYGIRHTDRSYSDATQAKFAIYKKTGDFVIGAELGFAAGADNLPRALVGLSIASRLSERYGYSARLKFEHFRNADVITFAPRLSIVPEERAELSVGVVVSHSSAVRGAAAVIDGRASIEIAEGLTLRFGAAYGEELDGDRKRDLRSLSLGFRRVMNDDLSLTATLSSEPGRRRIDLGIVRRF